MQKYVYEKDAQKHQFRYKEYSLSRYFTVSLKLAFVKISLCSILVPDVLANKRCYNHKAVQKGDRYLGCVIASAAGKLY